MWVSDLHVYHLFQTGVVRGLNHDELHVTIFVLYVVPVEYITYLVVSASDFIVGIGSLRDERVR